MSKKVQERLVFGIIALIVCSAVLALHGCGTIAGVGRDITAWADGGAIDAGDNARKIRGK